MDFQKYSKQQFEHHGLNSSAALALAKELEEDVLEEVHRSVLVAFLNVVEGLNAQGHYLNPYDEICAGDINFRDESINGQCFLRLACDVVISAGYSHASDDLRQ